MTKIRKLMGATALTCMLGSVATVSPAEAAPPPQVRLSANRIVLDDGGCFDLTVDGRKFVQNSNEWDVFIADVNIGFGDVPPDGTFSTSAGICGLIEGTYEVRAQTTDGQLATRNLRLVAPRT